jgi:hypothetical protein
MRLVGILAVSGPTPARRLAFQIAMRSASFAASTLSISVM